MYPDINGDGLADHCTVGEELGGYGVRSWCSIGDGTGHFSGTVFQQIMAGNFNPEIFDSMYPDINGDGLADHCTVGEELGGHGVRSWCTKGQGNGTYGPFLCPG